MTSTQYFLVRRLHSLLGVIPLGIFLFVHLTTNSMALFGREAFEHKVGLIHLMGPLLPWIEAFVIFVPLALHIAIGIQIARTGRSNASNLGYGRNWAYTFQRWTGWIALAFILYHTIALRFLDVANGVGNFFPYLSELFKQAIWIVIYLIGGAAVIYHFANGLCTFCMTWGITVGPRSQRVMAGIAVAVGVALFVMLIASIVGFNIAPVEGVMEAANRN